MIRKAEQQAAAVAADAARKEAQAKEAAAKAAAAAAIGDGEPPACVPTCLVGTCRRPSPSSVALLQPITSALLSILPEEEGREDEVLDGATGEPLKAEDVGGGSGGEKQEGAEEAASKEEEEEEEEEVDPSATRMQLLWEFKCDITNGRNVSCLGWNKVRSSSSFVPSCCVTQRSFQTPATMDPRVPLVGNLASDLPGNPASQLT